MLNGQTQAINSLKAADISADTNASLGFLLQSAPVARIKLNFHTLITTGDQLSASTAVNKKANCHTITSQHSPDARQSVSQPVRPTDRQPPPVGFNKAKGAAETPEPQCGRTHSCTGPNVGPYSY